MTDALKVLIIEDDPIIAMDIEMIVRDLGHDVVAVATTHAEAVAEAIVAGGLAEFATRLDRPVNEIWAGHIDKRIAGTIAIDGEDLNGAESQGRKPQLAHLRLFIVDPSARGSGLGKALLSEALSDDCDMPRRSAARVKCPLSARVMKTRSSGKEDLIVISD